MKAVKVDSARRIRLTVLKPGDYYAPEIYGPNADEITLHRLQPPTRQWSVEEVLRAIEESPLRFTRSWEELKKETR